MRHHHLVLLARNLTGYANLLTLSSLGYTEGFYYKPRIDDELLERHHEGLIALSACLAGDIPRPSSTASTPRPGRAPSTTGSCSDRTASTWRCRTTGFPSRGS